MIYEFQATQDLHGYTKPWGPGDNVNVIDPEGLVQGAIRSDTGALDSNTSTRVSTDFLPVTPGTTVYYLIEAGKKIVSYHPYDSSKASAGPNVTTNLASYTPGEGIGYIRVVAGFVDNANITPDQVKDMYCGEEEIFSPYANICPPEGFNIWDPNNEEYVQVYAGYVNSNTRELYLRPVYKEYAGEELVGPWMSSMDEYSEDATPTEGAFVIDFGGELTSYEITPFMLQTLLDSLGIRQHFTNGAGLLNSLMDQAQGRVRSEEELLHLSRPLKVIPIGDQLPAGLTFKPISKDVLPGLPGKFIR